MCLAARHGGYGLPQLFRNERNERVCQTKDRFKHTQQRTACGALLCRAAVLDLYFSDFQVPVTVLIPHQVVEGLCRQVETVVMELLTNFRFGTLQQADHPAIGSREVQVSISGVDAAILVFSVHQHKACGIPQLVAEVAIPLAARQIKLDIAAGASQGGKSKAQRIGAETRNAFREFLARFLLDALRLLRIHQTEGAFLDQLIQRNTVDEVDGVQHVALRFAHLLALAVADQAVDVHILERNAPGQMLRHHHHAGDPEEDDVEAGDEDAGRQITIQHGVRCGGPIGCPVQR